MERPRYPLSVVAAVVLLISTATTASPLTQEQPEPIESPAGTYIAPYENAPVETTFEANDAEVIFYSNKHDISVDRAIEIANWMTEVGPLLDDLPELKGNYAEARVVHGGPDVTPVLLSGELRIELLMKDSSDSALADILDQIRAVRAGDSVVDIVTTEVPRSLAELDALAEAELARYPDGNVDIEYDLLGGTLVVLPAPKPDIDWTSQCTNVTGGSLDGGRRIRLDNDGQTGCQTEGECTSGFPMRFNFSYGVTTAGHCTDAIGAGYAASSSGFVTNYTDRDTDMYWVSQPNNIYVSADARWYDGPYTGPNDDDVAFLQRTSSGTKYHGRIWKWDTGEWRNIVGYESTFRTLGLTVCAAASPAAQNGASTYCGEVIDTKSDAGGGSGANQNWTEVDYTQGNYHQGISGGHGGSGGTMFYAGVVYGMQSNADNCSSTPFTCTPGRYYRVDATDLAMRAALSYDDVNFICYYQTFCVPN